MLMTRGIRYQTGRRTVKWTSAMYIPTSIFDFFFFIETFKSLFNPQHTLSGGRTISKEVSKLQVGKTNIQSSMIDVTDMDVHYCISV